MQGGAGSGASGASTSDLAGRVVDGLSLVRPLGQGRVGPTYEAYSSDGRPLAVKVLRPDLAGSRMHADRLLESARTMAALQHRGIAEIVRWGEIPGASVYVAMEWISGTTLAQVLARAGAIGWVRARALLLEIADALGVAHAREVLHAALDPTRVWVLPAIGGVEGIKLVDFGLAGVGTGPEIWPASAAHRPPERRQGEPASQRGDVYALGAIAYEMVSGRPPRPGARLREVGADVPEAFDDLVAKALARDPDRRVPSMLAFADALRALDLPGQPRAPAAVSAAARPEVGRAAGPGAGLGAGPAGFRPALPPIDDDDLTTMRSSAQAPGVPRRAMPPTHSEPMPPPLLLPHDPAGVLPAGPRERFEMIAVEGDDHTSVLGGGRRLVPLHEQTSILHVPGGLPAAGGPEPEDRTMLLQGAGDGVPVPASMHPAMGAARGDVVIADPSRGASAPSQVHLPDYGDDSDLAVGTAVLSNLPVMREHTQILDVRVGGEVQIDDSMPLHTAILESPNIPRGTVPGGPMAYAPAPAHPPAPMAYAPPIPMPPAGPAVRVAAPVPSGAAAIGSPRSLPMQFAGGPLTPPRPAAPAAGPPAAASRGPAPSPVRASGIAPGAARVAGSAEPPPRDWGVVVGIVLGIVIAAVILGGGAFAGWWFVWR